MRWPPLLKVMGAICLAVLGDQWRELMQGFDSLLMLGMEGEEMSSYSVRSWGERERVGLTERLCGLGEDGEEDRMVTISAEGVDGERDKERLLRDSERGVSRALCVACWCLGMVPVRLLFLSDSPGEVPDCWAVLVTVVMFLGAVGVVVVAVLTVVPVPCALDTDMVDLLPILVTMMALPDSVRPITVEVGVVSGMGLSMACLSLKSVQPKTTFGTWSGSGVRGGG